MKRGKGDLMLVPPLDGIEGLGVVDNCRTATRVVIKLILIYSNTIVLMRPSIIVLAPMNETGRTRLTCGKNIKGDGQVRLSLGL
jgi:hypothetical protein